VEIGLLVLAVVALDVLATGLGYDSRSWSSEAQTQRAVDAIRNGDAAGFEAAVRELERQPARVY